MVDIGRDMSIESTNSLLFEVASIGDLETARACISNGANPSAIHKIGEVEAFPLYMAAQNGHIEIIRLLLDAGTKVDAKLNTDGATALYIAALNGHSEIVDLLVRAGADVNVEVGVHAYTPLYVAVHKRDYETTNLLLKAGAAIMLEGNRLSPLNVAASNNDQVKELVFSYYWKMVESEAQESEEQRDFEVVIVRYNEDVSWVAKEFPNEKVTIYNKGKEDLILPTKASREVKVPNVGYLGGTYLEHIIRNYEILAERTLFLQAYPYDHPIKAPLLKFKYESESGCKNIIAKCTPETYLEEENARVREVKFGKFDHDKGVYDDFNLTKIDLLEFTQQNFEGEQIKKINMCIGAEFAVDRANILSRSKEFYERLQATLNYTTFPLEDFYFERLWDVIFHTPEAQDFEVSLVEKSQETFDVAPEPKKLYLPENRSIFEAAQNGRVDDIREMMELKVDPNYIHRIGEVEATPLYIAAQNGYLEVVKLLVENGAYVDAKLNTDGATPLYIASLNGHLEVVELLLNAGADPNVEVSSIYTPLYVAAYNRNLDIVNLLLKAGSNVILEHRLSPLNIAASGHDLVKTLIFEHYWKIVNSIAPRVVLENDFEVVIVRYNEDISWAFREFPNQRVTIYNKNNDTLILPPNFQEVKIPNFGYLGGTYLYHIVKNYHSLAGRTLFLQGYPYDHPLKLPLIRYGLETNSGCKNIIAICTSLQTLEGENERLKNTQIGKFNASGVFEQFVGSENINLMEFAREFIGDDIPERINMCSGAQFAVDRTNILTRSLTFYQRILDKMLVKFPTEDWYLETLWDTIFRAPESNTQEDITMSGRMNSQAELSKIVSILKRVELPGNKSIYALPNNLVFVMNDNDAVSTMYGIKEGIGHEPHIFEKMIRFMREGEHFIEVGANYGDYSLQMARILRNNARVFAFEPGQKVFKYLQVNALLNDLPNLTVENLALLDQEMILEFNEVEDSSLGSYMGGSSFSHSVKSTTLDSYFERNILPIGAIRLDAQGAECRVLKGASRIIDSSPDIKLFIEWEEKLIGWYDSVEVKQQCLATLESRGFIFIDLLNFNEECHYSNFLLPASYIVRSDSIEFLAIREEALKNLFPDAIHTSNCPATVNNLLFNAVLNHNAQMAKHYIQKGADVEYVKLGLGANSLHIATQNGDKEIVELLVDAGANIEAIASNALTSLCIAAQVKQTGIVKTLIEHHANIECKFPSGANALYVSSYLGDTATAILLMKAGADRKVTVEGIDIVTRAKSNGHIETAKLFEVGVEDFCEQTSDEKLIEICGQDLNYGIITEN